MGGRIGARGHGTEPLKGITPQGHIGEVGPVDAHVLKTGVEGEGVHEHRPIEAGAHALNDGDILEIAGVRMAFSLAD